tara:strand:- start:750 stop:1595 length:846 start_codon:yes stop_codon:yes gene_type:complete
MENELIKKYKKQGISSDELKKVNSILKLPNEKLTSFARNRRMEAFKEAISWESGQNQNNRKITILYPLREYSVAVGKPGKEAHPDYKGFVHYITKQKGNNPNDMNPQILKNGVKIDKDFTFEEMFEHVESLMHSDLFALELLGMLFFRAAFMLDHKKDKNGNWRYYPPEEIIKIVERKISSVLDIPTLVFLHFLEVLSLNEDIKADAGGYGDFKQDYGRINTLLTFSNLVVVLLNRKSIARFAGQFTRPPRGMAPIAKTQKGKLFEFYPLLNPELFTQSYF